MAAGRRVWQLFGGVGSGHALFLRLTGGVVSIEAVVLACFKVAFEGLVVKFYVFECFDSRLI